MDVWKKITIFIIFLLFVYILFRLLKKRSDILSNVGKEGFKEGFEYNSGVQEIIKTQTNTNEIDCSMPGKNGPKPLGSFFVKSSFHSAVDAAGNVSTDMVRYVLSRGYRFLDFAVAYTPQNDSYNPEDAQNGSKGGPSTACVGYLYNSVSPISYIPLSKILDTIQTTAFTSPSPNPGDPVFIQIRPMKTTGTPAVAPTGSDNSDSQLYTQIQAALGILKRNKLARGVTKDTLLSTIMGKIVIVMASATTGINNEYIGLTLGSDDLSTITSGLLTHTSTTSNSTTDTSTKITTITYTNTSVPSASAAIRSSALVEIQPLTLSNSTLNDNERFSTLINKLPANFTPMLACMPTTITQSVPILNNTKTALGDYEELFSSSKSAFVDLEYVKTFSLTNVINNPVVAP
jgi:hypothetical protein